MCFCIFSFYLTNYGTAESWFGPFLKTSILSLQKSESDESSNVMFLSKIFRITIVWFLKSLLLKKSLSGFGSFLIIFFLLSLTFHIEDYKTYVYFDSERNFQDEGNLPGSEIF
ncbi:hypothetical protein [Leptospira kobayashii]|uniref:hypothetical protein n=1 Tax=Leptospira kobayashii TaxID=1917830 RepID=UPI000D598E89|nr:hypothetical protein [Leptospira kobayashii]